jgi:hypothetical protein
MQATRRTRLRVVVAATALFAGLVIRAASQASQATQAGSISPMSARAAVHVPHYSHIAVIMDYNEDYNSIFRYKFAPTINKLASKYGIASRYFTTSDPGVANDPALLTWNDFGRGFRPPQRSSRRGR